MQRLAASAPRRSLAWVCLALFAAAWVVYGRTARFDYVPYDDDIVVYENTRVLAGLTAEGARFAFLAQLTSDTELANYWTPLTTLSHMLVVECFGREAGPHHLVSVMIHAINVLLFFLLLLRLVPEARLAACALPALLFAIHPVHVESVAWITERNDVLGGAFWLLGLHAWTSYSRRPSLLRYGGVLVIFALGLLAKPTLVTFPLVLFLLDIWPLGRLGGERRPRTSVGLALLERLPFLALAIGVAAITLLAHARDQSTASLEALPPLARVQNVIVAYASYVRLILWPLCLAALYPLRTSQPFATVAIASLVLLAISAATLLVRRTRPWLLVGWAWLLIVVFPVSGVAQAGSQSHADRFLYLAVHGLGMALAVELSRASSRSRRPRALVAAALAVVALCGALAWMQVGTWRDGETLFRRMLACTNDNPIAHSKLGWTLIDRDQLDEAEEHFRASLDLLPGLPFPRLGLAVIAQRRNDPSGARLHLDRVLRDHPDSSDAHYQLGMVDLRQNAPASAEEHFRQACRLDPDSSQARSNLAAAIAMQGRIPEAEREFAELVRLFPSDPHALCARGGFLASQGRMREAIELFEAALRIDPEHAQAKLLLERARSGGQ